MHQEHRLRRRRVSFGQPYGPKISRWPLCLSARVSLSLAEVPHTRGRSSRMDSLGSAYRDTAGSPATSDRRGEAANRREAISQLEAVVKVSTEVLGPEHRDTIANEATLAKLREAHAREAS